MNVKELSVKYIFERARVLFIIRFVAFLIFALFSNAYLSVMHCFDRCTMRSISFYVMSESGANSIYLKTI